LLTYLVYENQFVEIVADTEFMRGKKTASFQWEAVKSNARFNPY
jgi:hypothetical protein